MGVAEPDVDVQALAELPEIGHFAGPVVGQALAHEGRHLLHLPREAFQRSLCRAIIHLAQDQVAAVTFNQYANGRAVVGTLDQVALPVSGNQTIPDLLGAVLDTQLLGHETAPCSRCGAAIAPPGFGAAQRLDESLFQLPTRLGIDGGVDGLVADQAGAFRCWHTP